jgi:hypothetical protein
LRKERQPSGKKAFRQSCDIALNKSNQARSSNARQSIASEIALLLILRTSLRIFTIELVLHSKANTSQQVIKIAILSGKESHCA